MRKGFGLSIAMAITLCWTGSFEVCKAASLRDLIEKKKIAGDNSSAFTNAQQVQNNAHGDEANKVHEGDHNISPLSTRFMQGTALRSAIETAISQELEKNYGTSLQPTFANWVEIAYPISSFHIEEIAVTPDHSKFEAQLTLISEKGTLTHRVYGKLDQLVPVLALSKSLQFGEVVEAADVTTIEIPLKRFSKYYLTDPKDVIGKTPKRNFVKMGVPLSSQDLTAVLLVQKGDPVKVSYRAPNLEMTTSGQALESGGLGDKVRLEVSGSKNVIYATIVGKNQAEILSDA